MKRNHSLKFVAPAVLLGLAMAMPAFAQESAGDAMHAAGSNLKQAGSDTAAAAEDVYHGTKIEVKDTTVNMRVKKALHNDPALGAASINVYTRAGVVTLQGQVSSREAADRARDIAEHTEGVRRVKNNLTVVSASRTD